MRNFVVIVALALPALLAAPPGGGSPATTAPVALADAAPRDPSARAIARLQQSLPPGATMDVERAFTAPSGRTIVRLRQRAAGLEVFGGGLTAVIDHAGRVTTRGAIVASGAPADPLLPAARAAAIAARAVGAPPPGPVAASGPAPERRTQFARRSYIAPPAARLVAYDAHGAISPAWLITLPASLGAWHDILVDARTGAVVYAANRAAHAGPQGEAFFDDPDDGPPVTVDFAGPLASPRDAWTADGYTAGNNVIAGIDRDADLEPSSVAITPRGFSNAFELSNGVEHAADVDLAVMNVFYWMNVAHDRFYSLGFTEAAGNYQQDNFSAGGAGGDPVIALVQWAAEHCDFSPFIICANDAMFIPQEDGLPGYAAFTLHGPPHRYIDGAFAADVVVHEYAHGVSHRLVGVGMLGGPHGFALGEGWSDWLAASFTGDPVFAEYWEGDTVRGVRFHSMAESPLTYARFCQIHPQGCEGHADGEIWAAALWDIRRSLIDRYGEAAGARRADELVVEGMMLTPPQPSFTDARDGLLEADIGRGGPDHCALWTAFAGRGLGAGAIGEGWPANTAVAAFDIPARCQATGPNSDSDGMPDAWERALPCLDPFVADGLADPDNDGMVTVREWILGANPCDSDTDGDGCGDLIETEPAPLFGGGRDPLDPWDFFDVTGDRAITLDDALDVLAYFGASGPAAPPAGLRDRFIPDPARPWKTARALDGVDLTDALAVLKSFGTLCAG